MHILFFMATLAIYPRVFLDSNLLFFLITALVGILAMHCRITLGTHIVSSLVGVVKLDSRNPATVKEEIRAFSDWGLVEPISEKISANWRNKCDSSDSTPSVYK